MGSKVQEPDLGALSVFVMGDRAPAWSSAPGINCYLLGAEPGTDALMGLVDSPARAVVLMDAALLAEADQAWVWSVQSTLGPVVALGGTELAPRPGLVSGQLPRAFLDVPGDVALAMLLHFATSSRTCAAEMERFMRDAIHEFRTPLTVMTEFASLCMDGVGGPITEKQGTYLAYIQTAGERLCREFDDYRDGLRMHLGALEFRIDSVPLVDVLMTVADATDDSIDLDCTVSSDVLIDNIDATRLVETIHRVSLAAKKLHRADYPVAVRANAVATGYEVVAAFAGAEPVPVDIEVLATGLVEVDGSPRRSIARVFGLGIAMGQMFLRNCGGGIRLEANEGKGGAFVVSLPTRSAAAAAANVA